MKRGDSYQLWFVEGLADAVELGRGRTGDDKVLGPVDASDDVHGGDKGVVALGASESRHDGLHKVGAKPGESQHRPWSGRWPLPFAVEGGGDEVGKGLWGDFPLLAQLEHLRLESQPLRTIW